jgi:hypothetical protein
MRKFRSCYILRWFILLPLLILACLCGVFILLQSINYIASPFFSDYLWSLRIARELSDNGYPVHDVSVSDSEPPGFRIVDVQVGNLDDGEQRRTYELVKAVHKTVVETFAASPFQPNSASVIFITLFDYSSGIYTIGVDFVIVQQYRLGEISEKEYFDHWSFSPSTPDIMPP